MFDLYTKIHQQVLKRRVRNFQFIRFLYFIAERYQVLLEKYENPKEKSSSQHSVPQVLLKRFKSDTDFCNNCIYVWDKATKNISLKPKSIKKDLFSAKVDLYDFHDKNGQHSNYVDQKVYRFLEAKLPIVLNGFEDKLKSKLTYAEEITLNNYMGYQLTRTLFFRKCLTTYLHYLLSTNRLSLDELKSDEIIEKIAKNQYELDGLFLSTWQEIKNPILHEGFRGKGMLTHLCLHLTDSIARSFWGKKIMLVKSQNNSILISDNPIIFWGHPDGVEKFFDWWNVKNHNIFFPISPNELIVMTNETPIQSVCDDENFSNLLIELNNYGQYLTSDKEIYSSNYDRLSFYKKLFTGKN